MVVIDAHQHFWELGRFNYEWLNAAPLGPIRRTYLPPDLLPQIQAAGVDRSVFVQTQHRLEENRWVLELARQHSFIAGIVGWVDLASPDCERQLEEFRADPKFVGVRHVTHDEPDVDFIVRPDVLRGLKVLERLQVPFDLLFHVQHLKHAVRLARDLPQLPLVIDHLSKPEIKLGRMETWKADLQAAAQFPNMHVKISGMVTEADWSKWTVADLRPYVEVAINAFGPERCMYGSDWPVCELAGSYAEVYQAARDVVKQLSATEQDQIFGGTANRFYFGGKLTESTDRAGSGKK